MRDWQVVILFATLFIVISFAYIEAKQLDGLEARIVSLEQQERVLTVAGMMRDDRAERQAVDLQAMALLGDELRAAINYQGSTWNQVLEAIDARFRELEALHEGRLEENQGGICHRTLDAPLGDFPNGRLEAAYQDHGGSERRAGDKPDSECRIGAYAHCRLQVPRSTGVSDIFMQSQGAPCLASTGKAGLHIYEAASKLPPDMTLRSAYEQVGGTPEMQHAHRQLVSRLTTRARRRTPLVLDQYDGCQAEAEANDVPR